MASNKKSICREKIPMNWDNLVEKFTYDSAPFILNLASEWKVDSSLLQTYPIGYDGEAITIPMRNEVSEIIGIQRRWPDGTKSCIHGSQLGLFLPGCKHKQVVVTEGFSDSAVATQLGFYGIGKPCAGFGEQLVRKYLENIEYKGEVILCADNDSAGERSRVKLELALKDWDTRVVVPTSDLKQFYLDNGRNSTKALLKM